MSKVLITGCNGMLGSALMSVFPDATFLKGKKDLDLSNPEMVKNWFGNKKFTTIIHCAALTNLRECEKNPARSYALHASVINRFNAHSDRVVYVSTVPIWERHFPTNVYFSSKRAGEKNTLKKPNNIVLRTNIFGKSNLVEWAYKNLVNKNSINGFTDSVFNPVHVHQLAHSMHNLIARDEVTGIYTISGDTVLSKYEFIVRLAEKLNLNSQLIHPVEHGPENLVIENADEELSLSAGLEILYNEYSN